MNLDEPGWDVTVFTKNRNRLLEAYVARVFLAEVVKQAQNHNLLSDEHFTVDGTLIEAWASLKASIRRIRRTRRRMIPGTRLWIFMGRTGATRRMCPRPIRTRCWRARARARKPSLATTGIRSPRIAKG